jgi:hypothetical protein
MSHHDHRHGANECPSCGRFVSLTRNVRYRRHYVIEPDGRRHLCGGSGVSAEGTVSLLAVEPTPEERYAHALRLLRA